MIENNNTTDEIFNEFENIFINMQDVDDSVQYYFSNGPMEEIQEKIIKKTVKLWKTRPESCVLTKNEFALKCLVAMAECITIKLKDFSYDDIEQQ